MIKGLLLGSVSGLALSGLFLAAVSLVAPPPAQFPQRPMAALPAAPDMGNQAEASPVVPEPLPERVAAVPAPAATAEPREVDVAEVDVPQGVTIPRASQFNRPREDGVTVTPATDAQPSTITQAALRTPAMDLTGIEGPAPQTQSAGQPAFGTVATFAAAPEAGVAPTLPSAPSDTAPQTFANVAAAAPQEESVPTSEPTANLVETDKSEALAQADVAEDTTPSLEQLEAFLPEPLEPLTPPTDVLPTQSNGIRLVTGEDVVQVRPGSSAATVPAEAPAAAATPEVQISIGEPRRIILDSERRAQDAAADESGAIAAAVTASGAPNALRDNSVDFEGAGDLPLFSLVLIDDPSGGVDRKALTALDLPVTFAIDPTREDAALVADMYRDAGYEVVLLADSLVLFGTPQDVQIAVTGAMAAVPQAIGLLDSSVGGFAGDREALATVLPSLSEAGMGFVAFPSGLNTGVTAAQREGVPSGTVYRSIDEDNESAPRITRFLDRATFEAVQDGSVIVVGHTRPDTIAAVQSWRLGNRADSVAPAPLSAILTQSE